MKLRNQQEEVASLKGYTKREISDLNERMQLAHDLQLQRITEMVIDCPKFSSAFCLDLIIAISMF